MGWRTVLEEVIRDRRSDLVGYASLYAPDRAGAEDLVQDALVRVFARTRSLRTVPAAEQYVRRAIRTAFLDRARKDRTWRANEHLLVHPVAADGPERSVPAVLDVRAALTRLSPRERACVILRFYDDLTVAEIAAEIGVGTGSVKRYLSDGTAKLRSALPADVDTSDHDDRGTGVVVTISQTAARRAG
ncbi:MAG: sigma-70 family RNA polymerase sigma factor [Actinomycetales bacterium]|nr:sigma-70 family RNA polymerase sigma factor [Actinomycetales bacterium]